MRIGIDASTWPNARGFGRFTRALVEAMLRQSSGHEFILLADQAIAAPANAACVHVPTRRLTHEAAVADGNRSPADLLRFSAAAARQRFDVLFYPAVYSWFPCPPWLPNVLTLHDAIAEHFPGMVFPQARERRLWNLKVKLACAQASRFLTVSQAARQEIVTYMKLDPQRIDLTTEGPHPAFTPLPATQSAESVRAELALSFGLPAGARYFCCVGGFSPHKNVIGVVRALAMLSGPEHAGVHLLLVGDRKSQGFSSNVDELQREIDASPALASRIHFTGFVSDEMLARIYATSVALVMPSFSEGFGLPAVEAMACAAPVIVSNLGSLPEVVGDAGLLVDPSQPAEIAAAMARLVQQPQLAADLARRSVARAALFNWDRAAVMALECLERASKGRR